MHHHHHHGTRTVLTVSFIATAIFVVIEAAAGVNAHSLALLSDAGHNFTDALALLLALFGVYLQSKPADDVKTFGYHRGGVLAAFVNALTLVVLSLYLFYESYQRLLHPEAVAEWTMVGVASLGLVLNVAILLGLRGGQEHDHRHDVNIRAAAVHMLGDALGSVAIIVGAVTIHYTGWTSIDPILSILIGILIIWSAVDIVRESLNILLEGLPRGIELRSVITAMRQIPGVIDVHDLHIWSLGSGTHALSCHAQIEDMPPSASESILQEMKRVLGANFKIHHTTVQFEHARCDVPENGCCIISDAQRHSHTH
ncbi:MAG TPA: cation diffusion facilitator family transporter [Bryobacteraceae bacterium]|nr:cation diffusion facilitator family transporter [Bryobacteraceae bacterium]